MTPRTSLLALAGMLTLAAPALAQEVMQKLQRLTELLDSLE